VAKKLNTFDWRNFKDADLKRKFKKLSKLDYAALPEAKYKELLGALSSMQSNYAKVKVCDYNDKTKCDLALEPELTEILISSRDPEELKYYWLEWYNRAGAPTKEDFKKYVALNREAALMNGFKSGAESWLDEYEDETFEQQIDAVIEQLLPLYKQLHAYVRFKLQQKYGESVVPSKGPIPMHLVGNMWAQTWDQVADFTTPFPNKKLLDVTDEMLKQGYTPLKMFQMGDEFFQSLNMTKVPQ
jgi:peptidyl-dipeptidase A